jgi:hypothetical protein
MTKIEAMKVAIDALELMIYDEAEERNKEAICVLQAELAKPEPEPVAWGVIKRGERVWYINESKSVCDGYAMHFAHKDANGYDQEVIPLYRKEGI